MILLRILAGLLLLLWLLSLMRVGGWVEYSRTGLLVKVKVGPVWIRVVPPREKKPGEKEGKPEKEKKPGRNLGGSWELFRELLPVVTDAAGRLVRKIRIDRLKLDLVWSDPDPARCAVGFGAVNGLLGMIWPPIEQNFNVKEHQIRTDVDFDAGKPVVYLQAEATLRLGQALFLGLRAGRRVLAVYRRSAAVTPNNEKTQKKEAV